MQATTLLPSQLLTPASFWSIADTEKMAAEYQVDENLRFLQTASIETLRRIFVQYRFFTIYYISDLALLVAKLPFGTLRSSLAEFLNDELGNGNQSGAHPRLYDDFLRSLGVGEEALTAANPACIATLEGVSRSLSERSWAYGVGLRGMGGECLCQIYLSSMYDNFMQNPAIQRIKDQLAWKFWEIHIGDVDIHHRERTRDAINQLITSSPDLISDLAAGYLESKGAWDAFWKRIYFDAVAN
jgi:hypothetical protein